MTAKQRLLKDNKKALQFLHTASGFDFQKPHEIIYHEGNYTINAMCKQIQNANNKIIVLLVQYSSYGGYGRKLAFVPIINGKAEPSRHNNISYWGYNIDYFVGKGYFERQRKEVNTFCYMIAQDKKYIKIPEEKKIDISQRAILNSFSVCGDGKGNTYINRIELTQGNLTETKQINIYYQKISNINDYIDKSGYFIYQKKQNLINKANNLRTERKKAEFLQTDFTVQNKQINALVTSAKYNVLELLEKSTTHDEVSKVKKLIYELEWLYFDAERHYERCENKSYKSIELATTAIKTIEEKATKIIKGS